MLRLLLLLLLLLHLRMWLKRRIVLMLLLSLPEVLRQLLLMLLSLHQQRLLSPELMGALPGFLWYVLGTEGSERKSLSVPTARRRCAIPSSSRCGCLRDDSTHLLA